MPGHEIVLELAVEALRDPEGQQARIPLMEPH